MTEAEPIVGRQWNLTKVDLPFDEEKAASFDFDILDASREDHSFRS
jgi:hypothetical protein